MTISIGCYGMHDFEILDDTHSIAVIRAVKHWDPTHADSKDLNRNDGYVYDDAAGMALAHVYAAAEEILAALQYVNKTLVSIPAMRHMVEDDIRRVQAAIAKALGQEAVDAAH